MKDAKTTPDERVDADTIARIYNVDRMTIYRMRKKGELPAMKVGGQFRFDVKEVEQALRAANKAHIQPA